jgi:hypothetical protein
VAWSTISSGSRTTRSATRPGAIRPRSDSPNRRAGKADIFRMASSSGITFRFADPATLGGFPDHAGPSSAVVNGTERRLENARASLGARAAHARLLMFAPAFHPDLVAVARAREDVERVDLDRLYKGS